MTLLEKVCISVAECSSYIFLVFFKISNMISLLGMTQNM